MCFGREVLIIWLARMTHHSFSLTKVENVFNCIQSTFFLGGGANAGRVGKRDILREDMEAQTQIPAPDSERIDTWLVPSNVKGMVTSRNFLVSLKCHLRNEDSRISGHRSRRKGW